jgi:uncharacterized membrane protein
MDDAPQPEPPATPQPPPSTDPVLGSMDATSLASAMHIAGIFFGFVPGLLVYLLRPDDPFLRHHATQSLNLHITSFIGFLVALVLIFVLIGFFLIFGILFGTLAVQVVAAIAANRGEYYAMPFILQVVK